MSADQPVTHSTTVHWRGRAVRGRDRRIAFEIVCTCGWSARTKGGGQRAAERVARQHEREGGKNV